LYSPVAFEPHSKGTSFLFDKEPGQREYSHRFDLEQHEVFPMSQSAEEAFWLSQGYTLLLNIDAESLDKGDILMVMGDTLKIDTVTIHGHTATIEGNYLGNLGSVTVRKYCISRAYRKIE
jgi:hypothetical protein